MSLWPIQLPRSPLCYNSSASEAFKKLWERWETSDDIIESWGYFHPFFFLFIFNWLHQSTFLYHYQKAHGTHTQTGTHSIQIQLILIEIDAREMAKVHQHKIFIIALHSVWRCVQSFSSECRYQSRYVVAAVCGWLLHLILSMHCLTASAPITNEWNNILISSVHPSFNCYQWRKNGRTWYSAVACCCLALECLGRCANILFNNIRFSLSIWRISSLVNVQLLLVPFLNLHPKWQSTQNELIVIWIEKRPHFTVSPVAKPAIASIAWNRCEKCDQCHWIRAECCCRFRHHNRSCLNLSHNYRFVVQCRSDRWRHPQRQRQQLHRRCEYLQFFLQVPKHRCNCADSMAVSRSSLHLVCP